MLIDNVTIGSDALHSQDTREQFEQGTVPDYSTPKTLYDFENFTDDTALQSEFYANAGGDPLNVTLAAGQGANGTTAMKVEYGAKSKGWCALQSRLTDIESNWTGAEGIRFWISGGGNGALDDLSALYETLTRRFRHGNIAGDSGESIDAEQRAAKAAQQSHDTSHGTGSDGNPADSEATADQANAEIIQQNTNRRHFAYRPNLVVVDGGKPQVMAAAKALEDCGVDDVAVCGLAKRLEEVWVPDDDYPIILRRQSEGMYLLQRVRDESHRFAITYHRQTRRKGALRSALDDIPGIGATYQKRLLNHFGSVRAMREATVEQLEQVKGIGHAKAEAIFAALHPDDGGTAATPEAGGDTSD